MNLLQIAQSFSARANDLGNELTDTQILEYLNRAYRYAIPPDIGGAFNETIWNLQTTVGTTVYSVPGHIQAPAHMLAAWIDSYTASGTQSTQETHLHVSTDPSWFEYWLDYDGSEQSIPSALLIYGRQVTLNRPPDLAYIIKMPSRGGPEDTIPVGGISNDAHANAVIYSALTEYLDEVEDEIGKAKAEREYAKWRRRLKLYAQGTPNSRHKARSF